MDRRMMALCTALSWSFNLYAFAGYGAVIFLAALVGYELTAVLGNFSAPALKILLVSGLASCSCLSGCGLVAWHALRRHYVTAVAS